MMKRQVKHEGCAVAHVLRVDVTADVDLHDPDSEHGDDTIEYNNQDLNEHEESSTTQTATHVSTKISEDNPEDEPENEPAAGRPQDDGNRWQQTES